MSKRRGGGSAGNPHLQIKNTLEHLWVCRRAVVALVFAIAALNGIGPAHASVVRGTPVSVEAGVPANGRAWELVSPPDTVGANLLVARAVSVGGDGFAYISAGSLPGSSTSPLLATGLARRGVDGWVSTPLASPYPEAVDFFASPITPSAFSPGFSEGIWQSFLPVASPEAPQESGVFRGPTDGPFSLLATIGRGAFHGASVDLQQVLFSTDEHLLPEDATRTEGASVYEVNGSSLRLVDVGDDGSLLSDCGSEVPAEGNPISLDGERIFFVTRPGCSGPARVYLREGGLTTVMLSASQCTLADCGPEADASFLGATASGSSAFIRTEQKLTDDDTDNSADIYRYDIAGGQLTLLSGMPAIHPVATNGWVKASHDGSRALFWVEGGSGEDERSLYLATADGPRLVSPSAMKFVQLSSNGRYALFATKAQLAGGDTDERSDVYRYDADTETTTWISASPMGGNGAFDATITSFAPEINVSSHPFRAMSDDGSEIFFGTAERLVPQDHNEASDVYEWKDGRLSLISAGGGDRPSYYEGATPDGSSVFFRTTMTLLPLDRDGGDMDFYVARVGGGFSEPPQPPPCRDDSCLPALEGRLNRPELESARAPAAAIRVKGLSRKARRRIVRTGEIVLLAEVSSGGRLTAQAHARIGRRRDTVASARVKVRPGAVRLTMPLSSEARHALAKGKAFRVRIVLRLSPSNLTRRIEFLVGGTR